MPYSTTDDLPEAVKALPAGAQTLWQGAFNAVYAKLKGMSDADRESKAAATAWAAIKRKYKKGR